MNGSLNAKGMAAFQEAHPGVAAPGGPIRAVSLRAAAGLLSKLDRRKPICAVMKFGFMAGESPWSGKFVLVDEAHNLLTHGDSSVAALGNHLATAIDIVLAGFTATPVVDRPGDVAELSRIICGTAAPNVITMPRSACSGYPAVSPPGVCEGSVLLDHRSLGELIHPVDMSAHAWSRYSEKKSMGVKGDRLRTYCTIPKARFTDASMVDIQRLVGVAGLPCGQLSDRSCLRPARASVRRFVARTG